MLRGHYLALVREGVVKVSWDAYLGKASLKWLEAHLGKASLKC